MKRVKITRGTYGHRPLVEGKPGRLVAVRAGDGAIQVEDEEANRLIGLGVAQLDGLPIQADSALVVADIAPTVEERTQDPVEEASLEEDALEYGADMTVAQLRDIMEQLELKPTANMTKGQMIAALDGFFAHE